MLFTKTARIGYENLFSTMTISPQKASIVEKICDKIIENKERYAVVASTARTPWFLIGALHQLESSCNFKTHLHNGDPLTARTVHIPRGRPTRGSPPFLWEESAIDALTAAPHELHKVTEWGIARILYESEKYNGWGYTYKRINSPYIWSFTNKYSKGKYIADGKFSYEEVSKQCGIAPIIWMLREKGYAMTELLALLPLIEKIAPTVATKLLGPEAGLVVKALAEALQIADADQAKVADALEASPTSKATEALLKAEDAFGTPKTPEPEKPKASPNGVLVDPEASVAKTLVFGLLFAVSMLLFRNAAMSSSIAEALTPLLTGVVTMLGSGVMPWLLHRSVSNANSNTLAMLGD